MRKLAIVIVGVIIPAVLLVGVWTGYSMVFEPNVKAELAPYELYVDEQSTLDDVYEVLLKDDVLIKPEGFYFLAKRKGMTKVRSGHYVLNAEMSSNTIVNALKAGLQEPVKIIVNGAADLADLAGQLSRQLLADSTDLLAALKEPMDGWEGPLAMGAFLPDTYELYWNASAESVVNKIYQNTVTFWTPDRVRKAQKLGLTPGEVSTLSSIVMKESSKKDDRPRVARLYLNRLDKGMKLQADPTVIHAIKRQNPGAKVRRVLRKDLDIEDPYNTYKITGLPPGPICVPEKQALMAVLNAPEHDYIFMCADPSNPGYHAFAKNYAGHLVNQARYTSWLNEQKIFR